jgi:transcriptional antiterminator NusG
MAWYIIHAHSGFEKKVQETIIEQVAKKGFTALLHQVVVPTEQVFEIRRGQRVAAEKKFFPGYVLIEMELTDELWYLIRKIPRVSGFLGGSGKPKTVPQKQIDQILKQMVEGVIPQKMMVTFEVGESVKVIDGPFESFVGMVEEVDEAKSRLKVSVSIFGRATPVDLEYTQVTKIT